MDGSNDPMSSTCEKAKTNWEKVHDPLREMLKCVTPYKAERFLLNTSSIQDTSEKHRSVHVNTAARLFYVQTWTEMVGTMERKRRKWTFWQKE